MAENANYIAKKFDYYSTSLTSPLTLADLCCRIGQASGVRALPLFTHWLQLDSAMLGWENALNAATHFTNSHFSHSCNASSLAASNEK
jgi:hypothetical protein